MREIKFRAWDGQGMHEAFDLTQNPMYWWQDHHDYPLMQFTGLKDKNGVEVYQDDLWAFDGCTYLVQWVEKHAKFSLIAIDLGNKHTGEVLSLISLGKGEVIGNIYENPDLLEHSS